MKILTFLLSLYWLISPILLSQQNDYQKLTAPYIGQKPPGNTPEIFAPGIVSTGLDELNSVFSPDGTELYFCVRRPGAVSIFQIKLENGIWSKPALLPFASRFGDIDISLAPNGSRLLFLPKDRALKKLVQNPIMIFGWLKESEKPVANYFIWARNLILIAMIFTP